ncbi:Innexin [Onchocerca flexuosa]|uniref:Innexin n=1 Tax=Onchocerca flexuosa TaxID=387005 RepID=A0A238C006_9BILA|nr:Innexin [Onchocerca flexuosa]
MIGVIAPYLLKFQRSYQSNDIIDRLNYQYTAQIIALTAFTLAATQYVGKPIQCWVPAQFTGAWEKYTETYCFIKGSYHKPLDSEISQEYSQRDESVIEYYQWVPIILAFQAFLFYFPSIVWRTMNFHAGINVKGILNSAAMVKKKFDKSSRLAQVHIAADHLRDALDMQRELRTGSLDCLRRGKRSGIYLISLYLFTKVLYVVNVILQFVIMNAFLGPQYTFWGAGILSDIWSGKEWSESGHFPRVTMCDFHIASIVLTKLINDRWWFILIGILSILSLLYYFFALVLGSNQRQFVIRYLRCAGAIPDSRDPKTEKYLHDFIKRFLRPDGVFILRLIEEEMKSPFRLISKTDRHTVLMIRRLSLQTNGGDLLVGEIVNVMFARYKSRMEEQSETMAVTDGTHLNGSDSLLER